jgi:hypothetical protein
MTDRQRALSVLIAVFLLGGIFGVGGTRWWLRKSLDTERRAMQNHPPRSPGGRQRVREQLQLTPEQELQYEKIMADSRMQMEALRAEQQPKIDAIFSIQRPRMDAIIAETNRKIMAILNAEQQKRFEAIWKEMNRRERRSPRGGRGMEPPPP